MCVCVCVCTRLRNKRKARLSSRSTSRFLRIAVRDGATRGLARVDGAGAGVVLDGAGAELSLLPGHKGVTVDCERAVRVARVGHGRGLDAGNGGTSVTASVVVIVAAIIAVAVVSGPRTSARLISGALVALVIILVPLVVLALVITLVALVVLLPLITLPLIALVLALVAAIVVVVVVIATVVVVVVATVVVVVVVATAVVVVIVVGASTTNREVAAVLLGTTLGNGHQNGLMVGSTGHGADTVAASRETTSDFSGELTVAVTSIVDTLEEGKDSGIQGLGGVQGVASVLNSDVSVTNDLAASVEGLGSRVVGAGGVGEGAELHVGDIDLNLEGRERLEIIAVLGVENDSRDHAVGGGNFTHCCVVLALIEVGAQLRRLQLTDTVAGAIPVLQTVGQCFALAEVDEVGIVTIYQLLIYLQVSQQVTKFMKSTLTTYVAELT